MSRGWVSSDGSDHYEVSEHSEGAKEKWADEIKEDLASSWEFEEPETVEEAVWDDLTKKGQASLEECGISKDDDLLTQTTTGGSIQEKSSYGKTS